MKLTCALPSCDRPPMRTRDDQRWCMWHPDQTAPSVDPVTGKLRDASGKPKGPPKPSEILILASERAPAVAKAPRARATKRQPQAAAPRAKTTRTTARPVPAGPCTVSTCPRPLGHTGRHAGTIDGPDAARRYQDGEGLFALAGSLHVGVATLRAALAAEGVTLRLRGQVLTDRSSHQRPIDPDEVHRLYGAGKTVSQIARTLRVKGTRVADVLREHGELRIAGGYPRVERQTG